jgi:thiol-disulfide isomerase/thioredoxin
MIRKIEANDYALEKEKGLSVVAFSAAWCPPCKMMAPVYEEAAARFPAWGFLKADHETVPEFFQRHGVHSLPTYVVFKEGKEIHRQVGALPASRFQAMLSALPS